MGGVHPSRKYDCEYSQPFIEGGDDYDDDDSHLNIGSGKSITLRTAPEILDIRERVNAAICGRRLGANALNKPPSLRSSRHTTKSKGGLVAIEILACTDRFVFGFLLVVNGGKCVLVVVVVVDLFCLIGWIR